MTGEQRRDDESAEIEVELHGSYASPLYCIIHVRSVNQRTHSSLLYLITPIGLAWVNSINGLSVESGFLIAAKNLSVSYTKPSRVYNALFLRLHGYRYRSRPH